MPRCVGFFIPHGSLWLPRRENTDCHESGYPRSHRGGKELRPHLHKSHARSNGDHCPRIVSQRTELPLFQGAVTTTFAGFATDSCGAPRRRSELLAKRSKAKRATSAWSHVAQPESRGMVECSILRLEDKQKWFGDSVDELVILPTNTDFTTLMVSCDRTLVTFLSKGMFETLRKFRGSRAHVTVDTKMKILKRQRGVCTI